MKIFLTGFGLHNPYVGSTMQEHSAIPIALDAEGGLDLDYSALLVAESFIIDKAAWDFIEERSDRFLWPMFHSLEILRAEGFLDVRDYSEPCKRFRADIELKTEQLLDSIEPWLSIARNQWAVVRPEFLDFSYRYSEPQKQGIDASHYGVVSYLERRDGKVDPAESARLHALLESRRSKLKTAERTEVKELLKPLVAQVLINDLLRGWLKAPFIDWDDAQEFHDRLHSSQWTSLEESGFPTDKIAQQSRRLFQMVIPKLLPGRIKDLVAFLRNRKAVTSLRQELWTLMEEGQAVSQEWMQELQSEAVKAQLRAEHRNRTIKWMGRIAGLLLGPLGTIGDVVAEVAEGTAEKSVDRSAKSRFEWYYALQQINLGREIEEHTTKKVQDSTVDT